LKVGKTDLNRPTGIFGTATKGVPARIKSMGGEIFFSLHKVFIINCCKIYSRTMLSKL